MKALDKYEVCGDFNGVPMYKIPVVDMLGVRSAIHTRRMGYYTYFVNEMLNGTYEQGFPLLCFIAGDGMIRVKHGNVMYWAARETEKVEFLMCAFPGGPEKTDALLPGIFGILGMKSGGFC